MKKCKTCGATYDLSIILLPEKDRDRINCTYCGKPLIAWTGAYMYVARKKTGPTKPFGKRGLLAKCEEIAAQDHIAAAS